ncbi:MAG TPA: crossover junction endodeoxyribonuclease RuvC [Acidobacteriota bacterium]|jgi:crossover junction endodeoxyribonuclease RuvC|nr:crossover junction endodeoxyribonuclease RuvC [Acidobacteriota bacterium]HRR26166.1 crossover junction endodeoxyribonuclease RuvC [Acidobacteriota bacterium]HRR56769.1 crossover junction endodeoxyribonuclease RuvC [Acidobacteriota bacterium]HRV07655.1 crossover junction endodeoxyribonuclease RuvC [Acidobacteriota bacterium]
MGTSIVLGLDPGSRVTGYGVVGVQGNRIYCIDYGAVRLVQSGTAPLVAQRLVTLYERLMELTGRFRPEAVAVESIFHATNVKSALTLGHARGVVLLVAAKAAVPIHEYAPLEVKQSVTGYGRADKQQVQEMVRRLLGLREKPTPFDASDALAVALCDALRSNFAVHFEGPASGKETGPAAPRKRPARSWRKRT